MANVTLDAVLHELLQKTEQRRLVLIRTDWTGATLWPALPSSRSATAIINTRHPHSPKRWRALALMSARKVF